MSCIVIFVQSCSPDSEPVEGAEEVGYADASGPLLFDRLASELSEDEVEISSGLAKRLYNAFQKGFSDGKGKAGDLQPLHILEPLKPFNDPARSNELIVSRVTLDENTGSCPRSGAQLRLINLNSGQKKQLQDGLMYLASTSYDKKHAKRKHMATTSLQKFQDMLE